MTVPPAEAIVSTPDGEVVEVDPAEVLVLEVPGVVVDVEVEGSVVVEVVDEVDDGSLDEDDGPADVVLVVGEISGAPELSLTPSDAAATTHQAATVTRIVASTQPRT